MHCTELERIQRKKKQTQIYEFAYNYLLFSSWIQNILKKKWKEKLKLKQNFRGKKCGNEKARYIVWCLVNIEILKWMHVC